MYTDMHEYTYIHEYTCMHVYRCEWDEVIGFDERLVYFNDHKYLFLFELLDFVHTTNDMDDDTSKHKKKAPSKVCSKVQ